MGRKKSKLIIRILTCVVIIACVLAALVVLGRNQIKEYQTKVNDLQYQIDSNQQYVYIANGDITAGTKLEKDINVVETQITSGMDASLYLTSEDLDSMQTAVVDIKDGQPVTANMVTAKDLTENTREVEINIATLLVNSATNDVVDVRVAFPDGSDYCILSKKQMNNMVYDSSTWYTDLNEQEILTLTSAVIDAYTNTGSYIYVTRYTDPTVQEATKCDYPVNSIAHDFINGSGETTDENIDRNCDTYEKMTETLNLLARNRLEEKLQSLTADELAAVAAGREIEDTANATAYAGMAASNEAVAEATAKTDSASSTSSSTDSANASSEASGEEN